MTAPTREGPYEGSRCLTRAGGKWEAATIRRLNRDGTFNLELDEKEISFMPLWYGVPPDEVAFNDRDDWEMVLEHLQAGDGGFTCASMRQVLDMVGAKVSEAALDDFWGSRCGERGAAALGPAQSYDLIRSVGLTGARLLRTLQTPSEPSYFKLYWNQTRMGGRQPSEVKREVTLADAFSAIGVDPETVHEEALEKLAAFEKKNVSLPSRLATFLTRRGIMEAVTDSHCCSPELVLPDPEESELVTPAGDDIDGERGLTIVVPHAGEHEWVAAFRPGEADARIYIRWPDHEPDANWELVSPSVAQFFWDLAQVGFAWSIETNSETAKSVVETDIGLAAGSGQLPVDAEIR